MGKEYVFEMECGGCTGAVGEFVIESFGRIQLTAWHHNNTG